VIKDDIVRAAADVAGVEREKATQAVDTIINVLRQALIRGERIELRGSGVFLLRPGKRGMGRNPKRPPRTYRFRPASRFASSRASSCET